ncbi:MAG: hypothetical protein FJW92_06760 [Actinobacteria bacterium]|nr:hypothetical protein [Actinomycetota bacterium]
MKPPSPALVVALIALAVALGGTGYAVTQLPKNSVGTAQIKKNAVTGAKVKAGSLEASDFKPGQLLAGQNGAAGATGARGPSNGFTAYDGGATSMPLTATSYTITTLALPAGNFVVSARAPVLASLSAQWPNQTVYPVGTRGR